MTGQELYEQSRGLFAHKDLGFGGAWPDWDELTPFRQANWNATAAEYVRKRLEDDDLARLEDDGGPTREDPDE